MNIAGESLGLSQNTDQYIEIWHTETANTKPEEYWEVEIPNSAPDNPSFLVSNSTISDGGLNLTNQTIAFNFLLNDTNSGNTLTWYVQPFNNSIAFEYYLTGNLIAVSGGSYVEVLIDAFNFSTSQIGDNLTFSVNVSDGTEENSGGNILINED